MNWTHLTTHQELENIFPHYYFDKLNCNKIPAGQAICQQGEQLTKLTYFVKGKIKIVRRLFNGKEHILDIKNQPTVIGDIELFTNQLVVSSVVALEDSYVIELPLEVIQKKLLSDSTLLLKLGQGLAQALYHQNIRASTNLSYTVKERLSTHILAIEHDGEFCLELATLADSFGISYRHLIRVIHELIHANIISKEKKRYRILQRQKLETWRITN